MSDAPNGTLPYRVTQLERQVEALKALRPEVVVVQLAELREEVRSMRRALLAFGLSTISAAIIFAFAVFELLGT